MPERSQSQKVIERSGVRCLVIGKNSPLSFSMEGRFRYEEKEFSSLEQAYYYAMCRFNGCDSVAESVSLARSGKEAKRLCALQRRQWPQRLWASNAPAILSSIIQHKMSQNVSFARRIAFYKGVKFLHAGSDRLLDIGVSFQSISTLNNISIRGANLYGNALLSISRRGD